MTPLRRRALLPVLSGALLPGAAARAQGEPHAWLFGAWTGGIFPAIETEGAGCFGGAVVIFLRDVVLRAASLDVAYRQRLIETVVQTPVGLEFRFVPLPGRMPPESGFGCGGDPDLLRVVRRDEDEIAFEGCVEFPSALRRCRTVG